MTGDQERLKIVRDTIEACARVADEYDAGPSWDKGYEAGIGASYDIADAIRALLPEDDDAKGQPS